MEQFAIMCIVSFETEVYVDAENLPQAMEKLARGEINDYRTIDVLEDGRITPLDFIKPQVWDGEDFVPCNVIMFPVKEEVRDDDVAEFEGED